MTRKWAFRLASRLSNVFTSQDVFDPERDADRRRVMGELDAIRARFREHA